MAEYEAYKMEVYRSASPVNYPNFNTAAVWNNFKDNLIGTFNLIIPTSSDSNFPTTFDTQVGRLTNIFNYLTGVITNAGNKFRSLVPWEYCGTVTSKLGTAPAKYTSLGRIMNYFPAYNNIFQILHDAGVVGTSSAQEIFAISPKDSDAYILCYYKQTVGENVINGVGTENGIRMKEMNQYIGSQSYSILPGIAFYDDTLYADGTFLVHYTGGYCLIRIQTPYPGGANNVMTGTPAVYSDTQFSIAATAFFEGAEKLNPNPYDPIPQPEPDPVLLPEGEFDFHSDPVPVPTLPTISAADTGFTKLYNPTLNQLNLLASYMWTDATFWDTLKNKFLQMIEDPMKYIISLNLVPVSVPSGTAETVTLLFIPTTVSMPPVTNQFVRVDCGTYNVKRNYGSALDFAPNTKVSIYLPYIGTVPLDVDEIMPSPPDEETILGVQYTVDVFSGTCVAMVTVNGDVKYQFSGHCAIGIPFSAADFSVYQGALIQAAKTVLGAGAVGLGMDTVGMSLLGAPVQRTSESVETVSRFNPETHRELKPWTDTKSTTTKAQFGSLMANNITSTVSQVAGSKPAIERSAGFSGNSGYLAVRRPYLLFESPRLVNPSEYGTYNGYPSMMYLPFANLSGFTQVQQIQLVGFSGTNPEIDELLGLLKSGVIF